MSRIFFILPVIFFVLVSGCVSETARELGTIQFSSEPPGAQIYLDSQFRGSTPSTLSSVQPGNYTLELRYPGYQSWSTVMQVSPGKNHVFIVLSPETEPSGMPASITQSVMPTTSSALPSSLTLKLDREQMIIGDSMTFTGTAEGSSSVLLTLYGPGTYETGVVLAQPVVSTLGWSYTWNPGSKIQSGAYTIVASNPQKTVSEKKVFTVIGGGKVTVVPSSYSAAKGDTIRFSGLCTTGASNVQLVLYGPERYAGGVELGTFSVQANNNWVFSYTLDSTLPTGVYTIYAYDVPKTTSGITQFTVGYSS